MWYAPVPELFKKSYSIRFFDSTLKLNSHNMRSVIFCNAAEVNNLLERKWISAPLYDLGALSKMKLGGIFVYFRVQTGRHLGGYTVQYPHHSPPDSLWNKHICLKFWLEAKVSWLNSRIHSTHHAKHIYSHGDRHMLTEQSQARGHSSGLYTVNAVASESVLCQGRVCVHVHGCPCAKPLRHLWFGCNGQLGH